MEKVILITGAARRIGAQIARAFHAKGWRIIVHYHQSKVEAETLVAECNKTRADSAVSLCADLNDAACITPLATQAISAWGRLDVLVNNASVFFPTSATNAKEAEWDALMQANARAPYFLAQACFKALSVTGGCVINIADIHGLKPLRHYAIYSMSKAALVMMTQALAKEWGPTVRVNAVAPGSILPPEGAASISELAYQALIQKTALKIQAPPDAISQACEYLVDARFVTGEILRVDGGR